MVEPTLTTDPKIKNRFRELEKCFRERVDKDNEEFGIDSAYLLNPEICSEPDFCLVCLEPSLGHGGIENMRKEVEKGFRNFLSSEQDFTLHYCAYKYLCNGQFRYQITDIAKGATDTKQATANRAARFLRWQPLLERELAELGNPETIAIGKTTERDLERLLLKARFCTFHYSWSNSRWIKKRYSEIRGSIPEDLGVTEDQLRQLADDLMKSVRYSDEMRNRHLNRIFRKSLPAWKRALLVVYRSDFSALAKGRHFRQLLPPEKKEPRKILHGSKVKVT
jgi:hypothetical protein